MSEQGECCPDKMSGLHFGLAESLLKKVNFTDLLFVLCVLCMYEYLKHLSHTADT